MRRKAPASACVNSGRCWKPQDPMDAFDRVVFENIVEKIIVGGYDSTGKPAPFKLTFVLRNQQSITQNYDRERYKEKQKEMRRRQLR